MKGKRKKKRAERGESHQIVPGTISLWDPDGFQLIDKGKLVGQVDIATGEKWLENERLKAEQVKKALGSEPPAQAESPQ